MYFSIRHLTKFLYSNVVSESMMETRMHPRSDQNQRCLTFHLSVSPRCRVFSYRDHLANHVHHFDIPGQHGQLVIVADATKRVPVLGRFPLPVEVIKFAQAVVKNRIEALGAQVELRLGADGKPFLTDENNHILDCRFGQIPDADGLARQLSDMAGVVEHGLFIGMASVVLVANGSEVVELRR